MSYMRPGGRLFWRWTAFLLVAAVVFLLSSGFRLAKVDHPDELWTLMAINRSLDQVVDLVLKHDNHPPLYYIVAKIWSLVFGFSVSDLRLLSFVFALLAIGCFVFFHIRYRLISLFVPLLLLGTNPLFTYYTATIRPYAMVVALASIVTLSSLLLRENGSGASQPLYKDELIRVRWIFYIACFSLGFTHYYGTLYVVILLGIDLVEKKISRSPFPAIVLFVLLLVWPCSQQLFGTLREQAESNQWVKVLPFVSTINNFFMANFPVVLISRQLIHAFVSIFFVILVLVAWRMPCRYRAGQLSNVEFLPPAVDPSAGSQMFLLSFVDGLRQIVADRRIYLGFIIFFVIVFSAIVDIYSNFSTPYYFLVCLPALIVLLEEVYFSIECRLGSLQAALIGGGVIAYQVILAHQRLALP